MLCFFFPQYGKRNTVHLNSASGNSVFCTPLNTPPDFHSLWGWLDFTQTCLARRMIFLTGGLTSAISRAATAHSEWTSPHKLAAGGELERTGGRDAPLKTVQHRPLTADFKDPVMNMTGSQRNSLWIQCTFLSRIYGLFRSDFFCSTGNLIWLYISSLTR